MPDCVPGGVERDGGGTRRVDRGDGGKGGRNDWGGGFIVGEVCGRQVLASVWPWR